MWQARQSRVVKRQGSDESSDEEMAVDPIIRVADTKAAGESEQVYGEWPNNLNQGSPRSRLWVARSLSSHMERACVLDLATHSLPALFQTLDISERMFGFADFPIEVLVIIAQFLAGSNAYGTLASLHSTSKLVQRETAPIFYETVILDGDRGWWRAGQSERQVWHGTTRRQRLGFHRTKHIIVEPQAWGVLKDLFRSGAVTLFILKHDTATEQWIIPSNGKQSDDLQFSHAPCNLTILGPVGASTLSEVLAASLLWSHDQGQSRQPITAIDHVRVAETAQVTGTTDFDPRLRSLEPCSNTKFSFGHTAVSKGLANTMDQLFHMIEPAGSVCADGCNGPLYLGPMGISSQKHIRGLTINLEDENVDIFQLCLDALEPLLLSDHRVNVQVHLTVNTPSAARVQLVKIAKRASRFYRRIWVAFSPGGDQLAQQNSFFEFSFSASHQPSGAVPNVRVSLVEHFSHPSSFWIKWVETINGTSRTLHFRRIDVHNPRLHQTTWPVIQVLQMILDRLLQLVLAVFEWFFGVDPEVVKFIVSLTSGVIVGLFACWFLGLFSDDIALPADDQRY